MDCNVARNCLYLTRQNQADNGLAALGGEQEKRTRIMRQCALTLMSSSEREVRFNGEAESPVGAMVGMDV
jgi:hypothetical protein